ncbi:uncharacterized protein NP_3408A [Natronomonas pharaonis DSM 2160]|uniref:Uncharacterized protein n=1 Tax=Natronomonas pharaonis (strain ATCC 35678 / DSM 2160 / CIP 103997 / JCM 8858 / NBRC 14720 / NCIMB 2260 / Gabara) TaxID=348780 RepID=A0A1U7EX96_NATPD|nr:rod-determining factor RdfA [Natronomonas pharaonis]CAI49795.1 uncharacterized protein NP_3408A [Natronomonas pharaonis DSM 2160]
MSDRNRCKVCDVVRRYDIESPIGEYATVDEYLVARWSGAARGEAVGYRTLTGWINKRILREAYDDAALSYPGSRITDDYETLQGDDELARQELLEYLDANGVDATRVVSDFVSWSTVRHHLKDCLNAKKPDQSASTDWEQESVDTAVEQTAEKTERALRALANKGRIRDGKAATIRVRVELECPECQVRVPFDEAFQRGYVCEEHAPQPAEEDHAEPASGGGAG